VATRSTSTAVVFSKGDRDHRDTAANRRAVT